MKLLTIVDSSVRYYANAVAYLNALGDAVPALFLRLLLAVEFGSAGLEKLHGNNWFHEISFPFPFNLLPADVNWSMATYFELLGAAVLVLGFATRFFSISLFILTIVAIAAVHWPAELNSISDLATGYRIIDEEGDGLGNFKLPLIYMVMFLPLIFKGAGRVSVDYVLSRKFMR